MSALSIIEASQVKHDLFRLIASLRLAIGAYQKHCAGQNADLDYEIRELEISAGLAEYVRNQELKSDCDHVRRLLNTRSENVN